MGLKNSSSRDSSDEVVSTPPWVVVSILLIGVAFFGFEKEGSRPRVTTVVQRPIVRTTVVDRRPRLVPTPMMAAESVKDSQLAALDSEIKVISDQIDTYEENLQYHVGSEAYWSVEAKANDTRLRIRMDELQRQREILALQPVSANGPIGIDHPLLVPAGK